MHDEASEKALSFLNSKQNRYTELRNQAKIIIETITKGIQKDVNLKFLSIISSGDTWIRFKYCEREFLIRCLWSYESGTGTIQWLILTREPEETKYKPELVESFNLDRHGNIGDGFTSYDFDGLFFTTLPKILQKDGALFFPFEPLQL